MTEPPAVPCRAPCRTGISSLANLLKSYQQRTGMPHEMHETKRH